LPDYIVPDHEDDSKPLSLVLRYQTIADRSFNKNSATSSDVCVAGTVDRPVAFRQIR
jgi:hypothetical protein